MRKFRKAVIMQDMQEDHLELRIEKSGRTNVMLTIIDHSSEERSSIVEVSLKYLMRNLALVIDRTTLRSCIRNLEKASEATQILDG
jgi:hypothetical protein